MKSFFNDLNTKTKVILDLYLHIIDKVFIFYLISPMFSL